MMASLRLRQVCVLVVLVVGLAPGLSSADDGAHVRRTAVAVVERWLGVHRVDDAWRGVTLTYHVTARRQIVDSDALGADWATITRIRCVEFYERAHHGDTVVFLPTKVIYLRAIDERCTRRSTTSALSAGAFAFDEELREASLDATIGEHHFRLRWFPIGETRTEHRVADAAPVGDPNHPSLSATIVSVERARDMMVDGQIDGVNAYALCIPFPSAANGRARCWAAATQEVTAGV